MGKDSLPLIFGAGKQEYLQAQSWYDSLRSSSEQYKDCYVPSFTRVKNLGSKYMHEYCQFIIEDRSTGERARVYAERMNEKDVDVVTLGTDEKVPRKWDELPLPLTSVVFEDKAKQPSLLEVAKVISSVSVVGGAYKFYGKNCFWFAFTAFDTVRSVFPGTLKNWLWVNPGGAGGAGLGDAWGLGFPTMFKYFFKSSAKDFSKERASGMTYLRPLEARDAITPGEYIKKLSEILLDPQAVAAYTEWSEASGVEVTKEDIEQITSKAGSKIEELDAKGDLTWTQDFDYATQDLIEKALADPNAAKFLEKYEAQPRDGYVDVDVNVGAARALDAVYGEEVPNPSDARPIFNLDDNENLAKALRVLVGAALVEAGLGH